MLQELFTVCELHNVDGQWHGQREPSVACKRVCTAVQSGQRMVVLRHTDSAGVRVASPGSTSSEGRLRKLCPECPDSEPRAASGFQPKGHRVQEAGPAVSSPRAGSTQGQQCPPLTSRAQGQHEDTPGTPTDPSSGGGIVGAFVFCMLFVFSQSLNTLFTIRKIRSHFKLQTP